MWILFIWSAYMGTSSAFMTSQEFNNKAACVEAEKQIRSNTTTKITAICIFKGI